MGESIRERIARMKREAAGQKAEETRYRKKMKRKKVKIKKLNVLG